MLHNYDDLLPLDIFTMPSDLRRMECGSCPDVFIGQDTCHVSDHILLSHPDVDPSHVSTEIEYSCLFCCQNFFDEAQMNDHVKTRHKECVHYKIKQELSL